GHRIHRHLVRRAHLAAGHRSHDAAGVHGADGLVVHLTDVDVARLVYVHRAGPEQGGYVSLHSIRSDSAHSGSSEGVDNAVGVQDSHVVAERFGEVEIAIGGPNGVIGEVHQR